MRLFKALLMLFPLFAFSCSIDEYFAETLSNKIQYGDFQGGLEIIEAWEHMHPDLGDRVLAMKASMLIDASCDALDNKAKFERNLRERQNMNGEVQKNSIFFPNRRKTYVLEAM